MKRRALLSIGLIVGLGALISFAWIGVTHATDVRGGDTPSLAAGDSTNNSLYIAGNTVTVAGTVKGDLFCAGQNVNITGTVEGDVICAGQIVHIDGNVMGDVRVAGVDVEVAASVGGSATVFAENINVKQDSKIGRDFTFASSRTVVDGSVGRDILGNAVAMRLAGNVGRNVDGEFSTLNLDSKLIVQGNLTYSGSTPATMADGAVVQGETKYTQTTDNGPANKTAAMIWGAFYGLIAMFMIGVAAIALAPRGFDAVAAVFRKRPIASATGGAASILLVPALIVLLFASLFGLPLAIILALMLTICLIGALAVAGYGLGWVIVEKLHWPSRGRRVVSLFLGLLVLSLLGLVPFIGGFVVFFAVLMGLGATIVAIGVRLFPKKADKKA
ncbi:MAG TPA: hypothetical protein VFO38_03525 [Candidatus Saccharimonadales bacterium]|nr:hypothetical protein [Candidatus Saccharimonadales bacterium]